MDFVRPITAAFDVEYAQRSGTPFEEVLNIICKIQFLFCRKFYIIDIILNIIRGNNIYKRDIL